MVDVIIMSHPQISIIGAGISGLVLGRCLLHRGIPFALFERDAASSRTARYSYGITLHSWAYRPLLKYLEIDEKTFKKSLAVDAPVGGTGQGGNSVDEDINASSFRANRQKFEHLLRNGLDVKWEHGVSEIKAHGNSNTIKFHNGEQAQSVVVVGADGPHSAVRKSISPVTDLNVLPFAVYNGKRRLKRQTFDEKYASYMDGANVIEQKEGQALMQISTNDRSDDSVSISYTYSRSAQQSDAIFNPDRSMSGATDIPDELFEELAKLRSLEGPFKEVFSVDSMKGDRLLNWLMRSSLVDVQELRSAAHQGIIIIGDSAHSTPILGGCGANAAIQDGVELAEYIAENGTESLANFYEPRYETWRKYVEDSEIQLAEMHGTARANL